MNFPYIHVQQADLPNLFPGVQSEELPHYSIPVARIVEAATLKSEADIQPPFGVVQVKRGGWRLTKADGEIVDVYGFSGIFPDHLMVEEVVRKIADKFNSKWG